MAISVDMLTWKGRIPQDPLLDERPQTTNECWEKGNQSAPGMSSLEWSALKPYMHHQQKQTRQVVFIYIYLSVHTHTYTHIYYVCNKTNQRKAISREWSVMAEA